MTRAKRRLSRGVETPLPAYSCPAAPGDFHTWGRRAGTAGGSSPPLKGTSRESRNFHCRGPPGAAGCPTTTDRSPKVANSTAVCSYCGQSCRTRIAIASSPWTRTSPCWKCWKEDRRPRHARNRAGHFDSEGCRLPPALYPGAQRLRGSRRFLPCRLQAQE